TDQWGARFFGEEGTLNVNSLSYEFSPDGVAVTEGRHMHSKSGDLENIDFTDWFDAAMAMQRLHVEDFMAARANRSRP
ncbi:gfo/Idh/MocA family oxidoreductase, partial [Enterococcus hirae]